MFERKLQYLLFRKVRNREKIRRCELRRYTNFKAALNPRKSARNSKIKLIM